MSELKEILLILAIFVPIGLLIGITIRKVKPEWCKGFAKFNRNRKWWFFLFGVIFSSMLSVSQFLKHHVYYGIFFGAFAIFELYALVKWGFKPLSPEEEQAIDKSDPTKLWPFDFTKIRK